jgi:hypothetical protein
LAGSPLSSTATRFVNCMFRRVPAVFQRQKKEMLREIEV